MSKPRVLFVCNGNIFRSRLAEAYAKSHEVDWVVRSAGLSIRHHKVDMSPWTIRIARAQKLEQYLTPKKTQLNQELLDASDLIIFMSSDVMKHAKEKYRLDMDKAFVWRVKDKEDYPRGTPSEFMQKRTYAAITDHVNQLVRSVQHAGWADVVDEKNNEKGFQLPVVLQNKKGVWHRGCHAVIVTPNQDVLIQKRSSKIVFSPNLIDISLGGHADAGETPEQAVVREIYEETGLKVAPTQLQFLEVFKQHHYHPRYKLRNKAFIYTYIVRLADDTPVLKPQEKEVAALKFVKPAQLKRLLRRRWLRGIGGLNYPVAYYRHLVKEIGVV